MYALQLRLDENESPDYCADYNRLIKREDVYSHLYKRINQRLAQYAPYCPDKNFMNNLREQYWPMLWQLLAFNSLVEGGFVPIKPNNNAPDLCFKLGDHYLWVEAVCSMRGEGDNAVPQPPKEGSWEIPIDKILLRSSSSLYTKWNKISGWYEKGIVRPGDTLIFALHQNACPSYRPSDYRFDNIELLTFGIQPGVKSNFQKPKFLNRDQLWMLNENRKPVNLGVFGLDSHSDISAVIYSDFGIHELFSFNRNAFRVLHNPNAKQKVPIDLIQLGRVQYLTANNEYEEFCYNPGGADRYFSTV